MAVEQLTSYCVCPMRQYECGLTPCKAAHLADEDELPAADGELSGAQPELAVQNRVPGLGGELLHLAAHPPIAHRLHVAWRRTAITFRLASSECKHVLRSQTGDRTRNTVLQRDVSHQVRAWFVKCCDHKAITQFGYRRRNHAGWGPDLKWVYAALSSAAGRRRWSCPPPPRSRSSPGRPSG